MIIESNFRIDRENRELVEMNTEGFPYLCIESEERQRTKQSAPWHWHTAIQINYVKEGSFGCRTANGEVVASKGDILFVNSGVMHTDGSRGDEPAGVRTQLFDYHFLSGDYGSIMEEKYFTPIVSCTDLDVIRIRPDSAAGLRMILHIVEAGELAEKEPPGFELMIRNHLTSFWMELFDYTAQIRAGSSRQINRDEERMKHMVRFVQTHYNEDISVGDIAAAAGISARECSRCFLRMLGTPPGKYLNNYRLRQAAILLAGTELPITEIAMQTGFDSSSYFSRTFSAAYGCSPRDWRKQEGV